MQFPTRVSAALMLSFLALGTIATAQNQYVILYPGANSDSTILQVYLPSSGALLNKASINTLPRATSQIIPMPDGSKYYVISSGGIPVSTMDPTFSVITQIAGSISLAPTGATLSPDGRRLIVTAGNNVYVIDTSSDTTISQQGLALPGKGLDIAINSDSSRAFVLSQGSSSSATGTVVSAIDLTAAVPVLVGSPLTFPGDLASPATGITIAPSGLLYLANNYRVFEINPVTLQLTPNGEIPVSAYPGKPFITPDGKFLVCANLRPIQGATMFVQVNLQTKVTAGFNYTNEVLSQFFNQAPDSKGNDRLYASSSSGAIYDLTLGSTLNATASAVNSIFPNAFTFTGVQFSNENPPKLLWATYGGGGAPSYLVQADIQNQGFTQVTTPTANLKVGTLASSQTSGGTTLLQFNNGQQIAPGKQSILPIVAKLVDPLGRPIFRGQITFTTTAAGVTISTPTSVTGTGGYAQSYITAPNTPGTNFTVTANGGPGVNPVDFSFTVSGTGPTGPGGPGNGLAGLFYVAGNGQLVRESFQMTVPMQVIERDAAGKPIPNVQVTWTTDSGYGGYQVTNQTDTKGYAMLQLTGRTDVSFSGSPTLPTKVTATDSLGNIVNFVFTTAAAQLLDGTSFPAPTVVEYSSLDENGVPVPQFPKGRVIKAAAGSLIKGAYFARIVLTAGAFVGQGIQGVGVCFTNNDPEGRDETPGPVPSGSTYCGQLPTNSGPGANCEGSPISDAGGLVTCDLRIGPALGTTSIYPRIGEFKTLQPIVLTVTTGPASLITSFSGDKQTAKPGAALPLPLGVRVTDLAGNNLSGVPITWSQILGTGAKLSATTSTTTINGQASINVTLPTTPGPIKIQATVSSTLFLQFDATVDAQVGGITVVSGDNQKAFPGQAFASPLVVLVKNQSGLPLPNTQVNFATAGPGVLSSATATTGADGTASTKLTAGNSTGAVVVTAIVGSFQASFGNLSVISQGPVISITSFLNAASFQPGISPCGLAVVQGTGLAPGVSGTLAPTGFGPNPTSLGPVQGLTIGGVAAPLTSVSNNSGVERVGFQVPCEVPVGSTTAIMTVNGGATTVPGVAISQYSPGMFETFASDGRSYAVALRSDGSFVGPANPAIRGETVRLFVTGAGQTTPAIGTNRAGTGGQSVNADLIVSLNTIGIFVVKSEYVAGQIGTYFVDIQIPMDSVSDPYLPISFGVTPPGGGVAKFSNNVYIPIQ